MTKEYINRLLEGNKRFIEGRPEHPNRCQDTRSSVYDKQKPFAVVVACSDSRVPVEIIFDVGIGDLFIIRTAGHVLSEISIASIEYAVEHLGVKLIIVLGHHNCGAVKTAIEDNDKHYTPSIENMIEKIRPAIRKAEQEAKTEEELFDLSVKYNILETIENIKKSDPILKKEIDSGNVDIVGANYHIETGLVELID